MALAGALCVALNTVVGFTNKSLRALVSQLLDGSFSSSQMTYDLRRLRLKGSAACCLQIWRWPERWSCLVAPGAGDPSATTLRNGYAAAGGGMAGAPSAGFGG